MQQLQNFPSAAAGLGDTAGKFKSDIRKLSREDRSFAEGIFRHHCPRSRRLAVINLETCRKAIDDCKRKITIPPSAVALLVDIFSDVSEGQDTIDVNGFLAILSRLINDSDAARRHRNRKVTGTGSVSVSDFKRVASNVGKSIGTFLGVVEGDSNDPSLEIHRERERRLTHRRSVERRQTRRRNASGHGTRGTITDNIKSTARGVLKLPGTALYEADYDEDPEEQPLNLETSQLYDDDYLDTGRMEKESVFDQNLNSGPTVLEDQTDGSSLLAFNAETASAKADGGSSNQRKGPPPPLPGEGSPRYLSDAPLNFAEAAPPLPSRDKKGSPPPLPSRDNTAPALPGRSLRRRSSLDSSAIARTQSPLAPALPGRDYNHSNLVRSKSDFLPLIDSEDSAPPLPTRDVKTKPGPSPLTGHDSTAPLLPSRDEKPPTLPSRDEKPPALPSRDKAISFRASRKGSAENEKSHKDYEFFKHRDEALSYYRRRAMKEKIGSFRLEKNQKLQTQKEENAMKNARSKSMRHRIEKKFLKKKALSMPVFSPWMIYLITYAQIIVLVVLVYKGIFDNISFIPPSLTRNISTLTTGTGQELSKENGPANMWIGPKRHTLIQSGATFAPCMRVDNSINQRYRRAADIDKQSPSGCCIKGIGSTNRAIYTRQRKCSQLYESNTFHVATCESLRSKYVLAIDHAACCTGFLGQCQMMTFADCTSVEGQYHRNRTCLQVNCIQGRCGFGGLEGTAAIPYAPKSSNQWWRFFTSLFLHHGIIHVVAVTGFQVYIGRKIEASSGWLRVFLIYIVSGMMSNVVAGFMTPYEIITGGGGAVCGLVAVLFVELFNMWSLVKDPVNELTNLCLLMATIFVVGTLPRLNNWAHLSGFVFGLLMAVILLPYISFGKWGVRRKRILVAVAFLFLLTFILTMILLFSLIQNTGSCPNCNKFNCIDFTPNQCNRYRVQPISDVAQYSPLESAYYAAAN